MTGRTEFHLDDAGLGFLSQDLEKALRAHARLVRLPKKAALFTYGSEPDAIYCLERGIMRLSVTACNGKEAVLNVLQPGRWFGEASLLSDEPRIHDARAVVDCDVLVVPAAAVHKVLDDNPGYLREFIRLVSKRYRLSLQRIDATILLPLEVRLAKRLLDVMRVQQPQVSQVAPILRLSQEELSQMLGVSRQSINKLLKEWEGRDIVHVNYGRITLLDQEALESLG